MNPNPPNHEDSEFLSTLESRLSAHLFKPGITISELLRHVFMSRTDLHRKLKKETGMSTIVFVRHSRLIKAKVFLLEHPDWSVFRIALEVEFANQSYFTKIFKKAFGITPRGFRMRNGG